MANVIDLNNEIETNIPAEIKEYICTNPLSSLFGKAAAMLQAAENDDIPAPIAAKGITADDTFNAAIHLIADILNVHPKVREFLNKKQNTELMN